MTVLENGNRTNKEGEVIGTKRTGDSETMSSVLQPLQTQDSSVTELPTSLPNIGSYALVQGLDVRGDVTVREIP